MSAAFRATPAPPGACEPTARQALGSTTALVGGNLAYGGLPVWHADFEEKEGWYWRTNDRTKRLMLRAERIDALSAIVTKDLGPPQEHGGFVTPAEWGGNLVYGGYVGLGGLRLPEPGCWRVSIIGGGSGDAVVLRAIPASATP